MLTLKPLGREIYPCALIPPFLLLLAVNIVLPPRRQTPKCFQRDKKSFGDRFQQTTSMDLGVLIRPICKVLFQALLPFS